MAVFRLEVAGPNNQHLHFAPYGGRLRGRWDASKVAQFDKQPPLKALSARAPIIPGYVIELDTDKAVARVFDSLRETEEGQAIWREVKSVVLEHQGEFGNITELSAPKEYRELTRNDIKTWMYEMRKAVDSGNARYVEPSDKLPTQFDIRTKVPGARVRDPWNTGPQEEKLSKYADNVPVKGGKGQLVGVGAGTESSGQGPNGPPQE